MSSEQELLDAIDANPDDDAPRLAHADWLEQNGDPERAAYVRQSLRREGDTYHARVAGLPTVRGMSWECRRGYPEVVRFESLTAFEKGWPLTAGHRVRHVAFSGLRGVGKLASDPALASIRSLEVAYVDSAVILAILRSPHLGPLRHLAVRPYPPDENLLTVLAGMSLLAGLRSLHASLSGFLTVSEGPIAALINSPRVGQLRELRLEGWFGTEALRALWKSSLSELTALEILGGNCWSSEIHPGGLADVDDGAAMPALERIRLEYSHDGVEPVQAVASATRWTSLRELDLSDTNVGDAGAAALANAPHLSRLERLTLHTSQVSDGGAIAIASSPQLRSLSYLDLSHNVIGRAGVVAFGQSEQLPRLRALSLAHNPAPAALIEAVEARFREGGPPVEEEAAPVPAPLAAVPAPSAPLIGQADEDGLVRAIWADPFDDVPRLIYADWLEEQGKPLHAAILRAPAAQRGEPAGRLQALMKEDAPCAATASLTEDGLVRVSIPVRSLRSKAFERDGPAWLRRHHVAEVCPDGTPGDWPGLFAAGWLAHARGVSFAGRWFDALEALAASPHLASLASLVLPPHHLRTEALTALFSRSGLRGLCRLARRESFVPADALRALCEAPFAPHLRHLALAAVPEDGITALVSAAALPALVTFAVSLQGDSEVKLLADGTGLGSLRNLDLSSSWFDDVGVDALAGSPLLPRLRRLHVNARRHSPAAQERLARAVVATPRCRLLLAGEIEPARREALAAILGDRLLAR